MILNLEREFDASPSRLFNAIREGVLFTSCGFNPESMKIDFKVGGEYSLQFKDGPEENGKFLEIVPDQKIVFIWVEQNTKVTLLIEARGKTSLLKLTHELIPDAYWLERLTGGWTYGLGKFQDEFKSK